MQDARTLYLIVVFLVVTAATALAFWQTRNRPLAKRLQMLQGGPPEEASSRSGWVRRMAQFSGPLAKLSLPTGNWEDSRLRVRFMNAGFRSSSAPAVFFAAKTALTFFLPALALGYAVLFGVGVQPQLFLALLVLLAAVGYFAPNVLLERRINTRKQDIFEHFPDAIDLMTVCVEAGLGLDAALARVGQEVGMTSPALAEELHLVNLELRAGSSRERALRNLALRTGVEEVDMLVALLVQSDRFGTSVASALRVHSDSLRTKRRQRAEENAARIPVKLLFPMIFCIFPAMLLVLLGPAFISIARLLLPTMTGGTPLE
jgi:tight adherence protein C